MIARGGFSISLNKGLITTDNLHYRRFHYQSKVSRKAINSSLPSLPLKTLWLNGEQVIEVTSVAASGNPFFWFRYIKVR